MISQFASWPTCVPATASHSNDRCKVFCCCVHCLKLQAATLAETSVTFPANFAGCIVVFCNPKLWTKFLFWLYITWITQHGCCYCWSYWLIVTRCISALIHSDSGIFWNIPPDNKFPEPLSASVWTSSINGVFACNKHRHQYWHVGNLELCTCYKLGRHTVKVTLVSATVRPTGMNDMSLKHTSGMAFITQLLCVSCRSTMISVCA